jgi:hypothetical protein
MKSFSLLLFISLFSLFTHAQHCPFDGYHLIAIKVVDSSGKMLDKCTVPFYLIEVENPMADSCTSDAGLVKKRFVIKDSFIENNNKKFSRNGYDSQLQNRLKNAGVFSNANMLVNLNQSENTCTLIGKSESVYTNYIYRQRKFIIEYTVNGKKIQQPLPDDLIYALCTAQHEVENFKALTIIL